jgi:hypothetical protein
LSLNETSRDKAEIPLPPPPELPMSDIYGMITKSNSEIGHIFKVAGTFHLLSNLTDFNSYRQAYLTKVINEKRLKLSLTFTSVFKSLVLDIKFYA